MFSDNENHMITDYSGHINNEISKAPNSSTNLNKKFSYATVAQKDMFPSKEQAIVIDAIDDVPLNEYIMEIGKITKPSNIRFASKISLNRVCIYLADKDLVTNIVENNSKIKIRNSILEIRPLLTKFKRFILSNVCPVIPHQILEDEFRKLNVKLGSKISFLRAGMSEPGFTHILSFRRQVYVHPDDIDKIPPSIKITYDDTAYWIYLSSDGVSCFLCKQLGHIAKNCELNNNKIVESQSTDIEFSPANPSKDTENFPSLPESSQPSRQKKQTKRPLSVSTTNTDDNSDINCSLPSSVQIIDSKTRAKKSKPDKPEKTSFNIEGAILPLQPILSDVSNPYVLNYEQLKSFLERSKGNPDVFNLSLEYTNDTQGLISMLRLNYPHLKERNLKNRFTRLINKLSKLPLEETESDLSGTSDTDDILVNNPAIHFTSKINTI